jgi:DNA-binding winged helix-turn-helix (wHTH) protein/predicted Zn-dependent protease
MGEPGQDSRIRFGVFELDLRSGELRKADTRIKLQDQPLKVLTALLEQPGELVTREELKRRIWPDDSFGDFDHAVNVAVAKLRSALADSADTPRYVETLPRRGYRFIFPVSSPTKLPHDVARAETPLIPAGRPTQFFWAAGIGATLVAVLAVSGWQLIHRNAPPRALTEKDTIVLADFANTTGDPVFDGTLRQGLAVQLEQSPFLRILPDQQIVETLPLMGQKPEARLTPEITREVCQRTGSAAIVDGSIAQIGAHYLLTLKALNCSNGNSLASTEAQASDKDHILETLGNVASTIRSKLGESLASIRKFDVPLEQTTTSSLEALKAYSICARSWALIDPVPLLQHAIELDPNFAMAYGRLADHFSDFGEAELASDYAQKAFDRREHASERDRLYITATYYSTTLGDLEQEQRTWRVLQQMYPRDWRAWNNSSVNRRSLGDYKSALQDAQEALRLAPGQSNTSINVALGLLNLDHRNEAKQAVQRSLARGLDAPYMHILLYHVAFLEDDTREMEAQLDALSGGADFEQSDTEAYFGRMQNSRAFSKRALEIVGRGNSSELRAQILDEDALREAEYGNFDLARQAAARALTLSSGRHAKLFASLALAIGGDVARAQALADELNRKFPSDTLLQRYWLPTIRASIELARKNPSKALDALQTISYEFALVGHPADNLYPVYVRGQAYLGADQGKEAAAEFQKIIDHRGIVLNGRIGALAHLQLGRAYALQGDNTRALAAYQDFLTLWKDADHDIPILIAAKSEYLKFH